MAKTPVAIKCSTLSQTCDRAAASDRIAPAVVYVVIHETNMLNIENIEKRKKEKKKIIGRQSFNPN